MKSISNNLMDFLRDGYEDEGKVTSYSGRGMSGENCLAVVINTTVQIWISNIMQDIICDNDTEDEEKLDLLSEFSMLINEGYFDTLGKSLVFYFPNYEYEEN